VDIYARIGYFSALQLTYYAHVTDGTLNVNFGMPRSIVLTIDVVLDALSSRRHPRAEPSHRLRDRHSP